MQLSLKTRVLLGLAAVCMCIVAAPLPAPDAPVRGNITAQAADTQETQATPASANVDNPNSLDREVVTNLPFTGFDVLTLLGVAVGLTLLAWVLHRLSRPRS